MQSLQTRSINQQGAALLVTLILMIVLAVLGTTAVRTAVFEERMARNEADRALAREMAESALRAGELWIDGLDVLPHERECADAESGNCVDVQVLDSEETLNSALSTTEGNIIGNLKAMTLEQWRTQGRVVQVKNSDGDLIDYQPAGTAEPPRFLVRELRFIPDSLNVGQGIPPGRYLYEITAIGYGSREQVQQVLQSTYIRRY